MLLPLWGGVEDRGLDYHLSKQCSVALNGSLLYELVVVAAITLRHNEKVVPIRSGNSPIIGAYVLVRYNSCCFPELVTSIRVDSSGKFRYSRRFQNCRKLI